MTRIETLEKAFGPSKGRARLSLAEICEGLASFYYHLTAATSLAQLFALRHMVPGSRQFVQSCFPLMSCLELTVLPVTESGLKGQQGKLSALKTWWPGTELNRRRQPFQTGVNEDLQQLNRS
jgi:hypothetical protein